MIEEVPYDAGLYFEQEEPAYGLISSFILPNSACFAGLTEAVLRPPNPNNPRYKNAREVLEEIIRRI